jgi:hypothetical protein
LIVSSSYTASQPATFMEVFKAVSKQELAAHGSVAIRADQKSYTYKQLISSVHKISNLLCGNDVKVVSYTLDFLYYSLCEIKLCILFVSIYQYDI